MYQVWRQDDNGNQFIVATGLNELEAIELVDRLEAKGHKQTYWYKLYEGL